MFWPKPLHSKSKVNKAGQILAKQYDKGNPSLYFNVPNLPDEITDAFSVVDNWRSCHGYPINTFQATLRRNVKIIDSNSFVAQRLKRMPSIITKLTRFQTMQLARMQDIGGLRAVVSSISKLRKLESYYRNCRFSHKLLSSKDYIIEPKESGYRGVHLVYKYHNNRAVAYNGLCVELQLRTKLQHAWATAVETMGIFTKSALKSSVGPQNMLEYFSIAGSAFALLEKLKPAQSYVDLPKEDLYSLLIKQTKEMNIVAKLQGYSVASRHINIEKKQGSFHVVVLNWEKRTLRVNTFSKSKLYEASKLYIQHEKDCAKGEPIEAVLVSTDSVTGLRQAYPNYFLDTRNFITQLRRIEKETPLSLEAKI